MFTTLVIYNTVVFEHSFRVNYDILNHFLDLMAIAEWLSLNDHDEFMNVYAAVRGSLMKRSLDLV